MAPKKKVAKPKTRAVSKKSPSRKRVAKKTPSRKTPSKPKSPAKAKAGTFPQALADLLQSRGIQVPPGLKDAPREAYAGQPASVVEILSKLSNADLASHAEKVAGYAKRQADRASAMWDHSPLITEIRDRKLKEPPRPARVVGAAFSFKKPLREWTDRELLEAANEWFRRGKR